ncbi:unnamed protein product [Calypogeia fissa]
MSAGKGSFGAAVEWLLMVVLMLYVCHIVNVYQSESLPAPLSKEQAGPRGFSEVTAREHIMSLVEFGPHPVGTEALDKALMYVYSELMEIKEEADPYVDFEVDLFEPGPGLNRLVGGLFYGKSLVYANLRHLVVRISPSDFYKSKENTILISSHIDTVITSPGAGDCSSCIAVMLELVRSLSHWAGGFKHSVIFLFNTGEEEGLDGAHRFMTQCQHPWSPTIRAAIDVEAMGVGGRATLFQAGSDKWHLQQYASVAKYPAAQIGAQGCVSPVSAASNRYHSHLQNRQQVAERENVLYVTLRGHPVNHSNTGTWKAGPFVYAFAAGNAMTLLLILTLVTYFVTYLHQPISKAVTITTNFTGTNYLLSILGGFIADSYLGSFWTILIGALASILGLGLLTMISGYSALHLKPCIPNTPCSPAGARYMAPVYVALYTIAFGVYLVINVDPGWGYGFCLLYFTIGFVIFLAGFKKLRHRRLAGSFLTRTAQVLMAAVMKRNAAIFPKSDVELYEPLLPPMTTIPKLEHTDQLR